MKRPLSVLLALLAAVLVTATSASSRPAAGITVMAASPEVVPATVDTSSGAVTYDMFDVARWSPEAHGVEGGFYVTDLTEGGTRTIGFPIDITGEPRTSDVKRTYYAGFVGNTYVVRVHWRVYNPGGKDGEIDSTPTRFGPLKREPAPRFSFSAKDKLFFGQLPVIGASSFALVFGAVAFGTPLGAALIVVAAVGALVAWKMNRAARDPVDLRFRAIAKPRIPAAPRVSAGDGLSTRGGKALNDLLALQVQEIGLWQAIVTSFDRSQGAHVKKVVLWEKKQVRAAGGYAARLSSVLLAETKLRPKVATALRDTALNDGSLSSADLQAFEQSWPTKGLPAAFAGTLSKLGEPKAEQRAIRALLLSYDPYANVGKQLDFADPSLLRSLGQIAAELKTFAKTAAKDPLGTGT